MLIIYYLYVLLHIVLLFCVGYIWFVTENKRHKANIIRYYDNSKMLLVGSVPPIQDTYVKYALIRYTDIKLIKNEVLVGDIIWVEDDSKYYMYTDKLEFAEMSYKRKNEEDSIIKSTYLISCIGAFITTKKEFKIEHPMQGKKVELEETITDVYFI